MFARHLGRAFLDNDHCVSLPLLPGLSDVPPDVDCTDPGAYFRFLWQQRRHRTRLTGLYDAHYGLHGKEYVYVEQRGYTVTGVKITGDPNVPRGKVTWQVSLDVFLDYGVGRITLAKTGFRDSHFGRCALEFMPHGFDIVWFFPRDEHVTWELITADSLARIPHFQFRTEFRRSRRSRERVEHAIAQMQKDVVGNVNREELEAMLD